MHTHVITWAGVNCEIAAYELTKKEKNAKKNTLFPLTLLF